MKKGPDRTGLWDVITGNRQPVSSLGVLTMLQKTDQVIRSARVHFADYAFRQERIEPLVNQSIDLLTRVSDLYERLEQTTDSRTISRCKKQIDSLEKRIYELDQRIEVLEREALALRKAAAPTLLEIVGDAFFVPIQMGLLVLRNTVLLIVLYALLAWLFIKALRFIL